jgi:transposase-like protein
MNLIDVTKQLATEEQCLAYLEAMRWPGGVRCPICGNNRISKITRKSATKNKRGTIYQCLEPTCKQQFSVTAGTIFQDSHLPLATWFMAIAIMVDAKKGMSALQLQQHLGIGSYRTAWYLCHRIRKAMNEGGILLSGTVEIDETYVGGKKRGIGQRAAKASKQIVMGAVERGGKLKLRHVPNAKITTIRTFIDEHVDSNVERIMTDEHKAYPPALKPDLSARHYTVNHIRAEYVKVGTDITTNSIESAFSLFKRGIAGSFHMISGKHLHRYLSEFEYRFNERKDPFRFENTVCNMTETEAMPYAELIGKIDDSVF